jgi:hypothetical protein
MESFPGDGIVPNPFRANMGAAYRSLSLRMAMEEYWTTT